MWGVNPDDDGIATLAMMAGHDTASSPHCLMMTPGLEAPRSDAPGDDCHSVTIEFNGLACNNPDKVRFAVATAKYVEWLHGRKVPSPPSVPEPVAVPVAAPAGDAVADGAAPSDPAPSVPVSAPSQPATHCLLGDSPDVPGCWAFAHMKSVHCGRESDLPHARFEPDDNVFEFVLDHRRGEGEFLLNYESVGKIHSLPREPLYILAQFPDGSVSIEVDSKVAHWCPRVLRHVYREAMKPKSDDDEKEDASSSRMKKKVLDARKRLLYTIQGTSKGAAMNFLLCGEPGVGKSSGINTFCTAASPRRKKMRDSVEKAGVRETPFNNHGSGGGDEGDGRTCQTKSIREYPLAKTGITIWDMFGMRATGPTRYIDKWERLMSGRYRPGFHIHGDDDEEQRQFRVQGKSPEWHERVHAAFIFVSATEVEGGTDSAFDTVREFITKCNELKNDEDDGIPYMVLLTKVDKIGKDELIAGRRERGFDITKVYANPKVYSAAHRLSQRTGCPLSRIVPMQNYSSDEGVVHLNYSMELQPLRALARAVELVRYKWPERFGGEASPTPTPTPTKGKSSTRKSSGRPTNGHKEVDPEEW